MPETILDCKDMPCPKPVLACRECIGRNSPTRLAVIVDNGAAKENVTRYLDSQGYIVTVMAEGGTWRVTGVRDPAIAAGRECLECAPMNDADLQAMAPQPSSKVTVFITASVIGRGDDTLGGKLMKNYLATLPELGPDLWRIIMVNSAVKLAVSDSPVIDELRALEQAGVELLVCGTCLEFFGLADKRAVGQTTNMLDVVTSLQLAGKVLQV
jgi:selenium metabolism protein YedF